MKRWLLGVFLLTVPTVAVDLRGRAVICVFSKDKATYSRLAGLIKERRDALKIGYNPLTGRGIVIYDQSIPTQDRQRLGIGDQALPCGAIVRFSRSSMGVPEKVMGNPPAIQRNMSCLFEADLMISRLLNLESEDYCVKRTGLSIDTVRYIRNLTRPNQELVYCVGRNEEEADQIDLAYLVSQTRHSRSSPVTVHVSEDALSDDILTRWGTGRGTAPFMAIVTNSPEGNPVTVKPESLIRNIEDIQTAAEAMSFYQENGQMPTSVTRKLPPLALLSGSLDNEPVPGGSLHYGLELDNVKPGANHHPSFQVKAILKNSANLEVARDQSNLQGDVSNFRTHLSGQVSLPANLTPGDYRLEFEVTEILTLQVVASQLPVKIGGQSPHSVLHTNPNDAVITQAKTTDRLLPGQSIVVKGRLTSPSGAYFLAVQGDGNLVIYSGNNPLWQSDTRGSKVVFSLDPDGRLRLRDGDGKIIWKSNTDTGTSLMMQDDGRLVMYREGNPIWSVGKQ
ncbi:hypothetical protein JST97_13305 [bacterium]|nr:hypothetical protein [bacterium]